MAPPPAARASDENSLPASDNDLQDSVGLGAVSTQGIKLEIIEAPTPLLQSGEETALRKPTPLQKKHEANFRKSGMKRGALLKFFMKSNPDEIPTPVPRRAMFPTGNTTSNNIVATPATPSTSTANCNSNANVNVLTYNSHQQSAFQSNTASAATPARHFVSSGSDEDGDSDIECIGEFPPMSRCENAEEIILSDQSDNEEMIQEGNNVAPMPEPVEPGPNNCSSNESPDPAVANQNADMENVGDDKVPGKPKDHHRRKRKSRNMGIVPQNHDSDSSDNIPDVSPSKRARPVEDVNVPIDNSAEIVSTSQTSQLTCTPPLTIVNVFTLNNNCSLKYDADINANEKEKEKSKNPVLHQKENPLLEKLVHKKNWKKAIEVMRQDLPNNKIPIPTRVSELIRQAILCVDSRASKEVQHEGLGFLKTLISKYPPLTGDDSSVSYYKRIFENVFQDNQPAKDDDTGTTSVLFNFLLLLCDNAKTDIESRVETKALTLLVLVTNLLVEQYQRYEKVSVKLRPPLFQHFLENAETEPKFTYNKNCQDISELLFSSETSETKEMFCVLLKWTDLIAKRLGNFFQTRKGYGKMVQHFSELCLGKKDLGLFLFLNFNYEQLVQDVCEKILIEKLKFTRVSSNTIPAVGEAKVYLAKLAKTLLFKPARDVLKSRQVNCDWDASLTYLRTIGECYQKDLKKRDTKGKNLKGETRLHIMCRTSYVSNNLAEEFRRHLISNPKDINVMDNFGNTALHDCAYHNKGDIARELLALSVCQNFSEPMKFMTLNMDLETPLHIAAVKCSKENVVLFKKLATNCNVLNDALLAANANGLLPFEVAHSEEIRRLLIPDGYDEDSMLVQDDITLTPESIHELKQSFALRKIIAWWEKHQRREPE